MDTIKLTELGKQRIIKNLNLSSDTDIQSYIMTFLKQPYLTTEEKGKNIYYTSENVIFTMNKTSRTIITAHYKQKRHYVYMLRCANDALYTGYTVDLSHRLKMHNQKTGAKYTLAHGPVKLVYFEIYDDKSTALKREYAIKQLSKSQKERMVAEFATREKEKLCLFNT